MSEMRSSDVDAHLESLVYSWADRTLHGRGSGVVGLTDGWRWETRPETAVLAKLLRSGEIDDGDYAFAYLPHHEFGSVLVLRRGLGVDRSRRPGRVVEEVLIGEPRAIGASEAITIAAERAPEIDWPIDAAPTDQLPRPRRPSGQSDDPPAQALGALLAALADRAAGKRATVNGASLADLARAIGWLPPKLTAGFSFASANDPLADAASLVVHVGARPLHLTRDPGGVQTGPPEGWTAFAQRLLALREAPPYDLVSVEDVVGWSRRRELSRVAASDLSVADLVQSLLAEAGSEPRRSERLDEFTRREIAAEVPESASRALLAPPGATARRAIRERLGTSAAHSARALAAAQRWGLDERELEHSASALIARQVRTGQVAPADRNTLAPYLQCAVANLSPRDLTVALGDPWLRQQLTAAWGEGTAEVVWAFWTESGTPASELARVNADLLRTHPHRVIELIRKSAATPQRVEVALRALPQGVLVSEAAAVSEILGAVSLQRRPSALTAPGAATVQARVDEPGLRSPSPTIRASQPPAPGPSSPTRWLLWIVVVFAGLTVALAVGALTVDAQLMWLSLLSSVITFVGVLLLMGTQHSNSARRRTTRW